MGSSAPMTCLPRALNAQQRLDELRFFRLPNGGLVKSELPSSWHFWSQELKSVPADDVPLLIG